MKLDLSVTSDIVTAMRAEVLAGERAVTAAMRAAGNDIKSSWRAQITRARLGQRLAIRKVESQLFVVTKRAPLVARLRQRSEVPRAPRAQRSLQLGAG